MWQVLPKYRHLSKTALWQVTLDRYDEMIGTPNLNKADADTVEARSVAAALSVLSVGDDADEDRHPERYLVSAPALSSHINKSSPKSRSRSIVWLQSFLLKCSVLVLQISI